MTQKTPATPDHNQNNQQENSSTAELNNPYTNPSNPYSHPAYHTYSPAHHGNQYYQQMSNPVGISQSASNGKATASLIVSLITLTSIWWIPVLGAVASIIGIILGHKAISEMNPFTSNRGMATGGLACGYLSLVFSLFATGAWFAGNFAEYLVS